MPFELARVSTSNLSTWAATAFASIGPLPAELESRSIVIELQRKRQDERVSTLKPRHKEGYQKLAELITSWVREHFEELEEAEPACPDCLYNRARDNWLPLLAVADVVGGHWPQTARAAAEALDGEREDPTEGVKLLADIHLIFDQSGKDRLSTVRVLKELAALEERPWGDYGEGVRGQEGRSITDRQLSRLLKPFGVKPETIRFDAGTSRGYKRNGFEDVWSRYLSYTPSPSETVKQTNDPNGLDRPLSETPSETRSETEDQPTQTPGPSRRFEKIMGLVA
jgi:putative DNA primase/helicase